MLSLLTCLFWGGVWYNLGCSRFEMELQWTQVQHPVNKRQTDAHLYTHSYTKTRHAQTHACALIYTHSYTHSLMLTHTRSHSFVLIYAHLFPHTD